MRKRYLALLWPFALGGCTSKEVANLGTALATNLLWSALFSAVVVSLIFVMNRFIVGKDGRTNEKLCSIIGVILFPGVFAGGVGLGFGFSFWPMTVAVLVGGLVGWFSYTLDELMNHAWEHKDVTVPAVLGLVIGGYVLTAMFTHVWLEGDMYVTNKACTNRVVVERYTMHITHGKKGRTNISYSWVYRSHFDRFADGWVLPMINEGVDYTLGTGALGTEDRIRGE